MDQPTKEEIAQALAVLARAKDAPVDMDSIRAGMSPAEIAVVLAEIRKHGSMTEILSGTVAPVNEPEVKTEEDRRVHSILTRDTRYSPWSEEERKILAAATAKALRPER